MNDGTPLRFIMKEFDEESQLLLQAQQRYSHHSQNAVKKKPKIQMNQMIHSKRFMFIIIIFSLITFVVLINTLLKKIIN